MTSSLFAPIKRKNPQRKTHINKTTLNVCVLEPQFFIEKRKLPLMKQKILKEHIINSEGKKELQLEIDK
jgi:hypothetical protein